MRSQKVQSILIAFFFLVAQQVFSQAPEIEWQNTIGGNSDDGLITVHQTSDGGYILGGYSSSGISGDKTENVVGTFNVDYWVVKLNGEGAIDWQNDIGGNIDDYLQAAQQTADSGYILFGTSTSGISGDKTEAGKGHEDFWVLKLNNTGAIVWQNTIGGSGEDWLASGDQTSDGGYILAGSSSSGISGDKTEASLGLSDFWIIKLDSSGNIAWQNAIGGSGDDYCTSAHQTSDGGYIVAGASKSPVSGDKTEGTSGNFDYWIIKLDASGSIQWQNTIGGNAYETLHSVQQTADGGYIIGGGSESGISGEKTEALSGPEDYWVIKLNDSGVIEWQNTIGGSDRDELWSAEQTEDGGYLLGGYSRSDISGDKTEASTGNANFWVIKLNSTGSIEWQKTIGGITTDFYGYGGDFLLSASQVSDGGFILGGYSDSKLSGDKTEACKGLTDYWLVKLSADACNIPVGQFSSNIIATSVKTNWTLMSAVNKYKVRYRPTGTTTWTTTSATNNYKKLKQLAPSTQYDWQVKSICTSAGLGKSGWSSTLNFTTLSLKIEEELSNENLFTVYPNPASDFVTIQFTLANSCHAEISLFDLQGRKIKPIAEGNFEEGNHSLSLETKDLSTGVYVLQLKTDRIFKTMKLIVQ